MRYSEVEMLHWLLRKVNVNKRGDVSMPCGRVTKDSFNPPESIENIQRQMRAEEEILRDAIRRKL